MFPLKLSYQFLFMVYLAFSTCAFAERGGDYGPANGGDAVVTEDGQVRFMDLVNSPEAILLDVEAEGLKTQLSEFLDGHEGFGIATYFPFNGTTARTLSVKAKILLALDSLHFKLVRGPLPATHDRANVETLWPMQGKIVRLGLQNRRLFTVLVDRDYYRLLPPADKIAFLFHEALIRVWYDDNQNEWLQSTAKIANLVHAAMAGGANARKLSAKSVARYLCDAEIMAGEKSNFGLKPRLNFHLPHSPEMQLPREVTLFLYDQGRCDVTNALTQDPRGGSSQRVPYSTPYTAYTWTFRDADNPEYELFYGLELFDRGAPFFSLQSTRPGALGAGDMSVVEVFRARLGFWTK